MPAATQAFLDTGEFQAATEVHRSLLETYRDDFGKYARGAQLEKLRRVFEVVPRALGRKVQYRQFHPDWKAQDIRACLELLQRAGLLLAVTHTDDPTVSKLYFLDVGLAGTANGGPLLRLEEFLEGRFVNEGPLAEQLVAQHLAFADPKQRPQLHYWLREGKAHNAEVDFLLVREGAIIPLEVKSGKSGSMRSLQQFLATHPGTKGLRFDLNPPSDQRVETEVMTSTGKTPLVYELSNRPLYWVGRTAF